MGLVDDQDIPAGSDCLGGAARVAARKSMLVSTS